MSIRNFNEPYVDVLRPSPNRSTRSGVPVSLIVIHSTEGKNLPGTQDLANLGSWFAQVAAGVSSHVATDAEGHSARYVFDSKKAWHCGSYNSASLGIEQVGSHSQTSWPKAQRKETAKWIAYWSRKYSIPIRKGKVSNGTVVTSGIVRHSDLGVSGGNHNDPGAGYDLRSVLRYARWYKIWGWTR